MPLQSLPLNFLLIRLRRCRRRKTLACASVVGVHPEIPLPQAPAAPLPPAADSARGSSPGPRPAAPRRAPPPPCPAARAARTPSKSRIRSLALVDAIQKNFHIPRVEGRIDQRMKLRVSLLILDGYRCLLKHHSPTLAYACSASVSNFGAGDEDRTRDQQLGRL